MKLIMLTLCALPFTSGLWTTLYWCDTSGAYTDPLMFTQEVKPLASEGFKLVAMDSSTEQDHSLNCSTLSITQAQSGVKFTLQASDVDGNSVKYAGNASSHSEDNYMTVEPFSEEALADMSDTLNFPSGVLNFDANGARLFITYMSSTEIVLRTCRNAFFGSSHSAYVFTTQADVVAGLDTECMKSSIKSLPHMTSFNLAVKSRDEIMACM